MLTKSTGMPSEGLKDQDTDVEIQESEESAEAVEREVGQEKEPAMAEQTEQAIVQFVEVVVEAGASSEHTVSERLEKIREGEGEGGGEEEGGETLAES